MPLDIAESLIHEQMAASVPRSDRRARPALKASRAEAIALPEVAETELSRLLARRASLRDTSREISLEQLSQVLALLVIDSPGGEPRWAFATVGGLSAFRALLVANNVTGLSPGGYWVGPGHEGLEPTLLGSAVAHEFSRLVASYLGLDAQVPAAIVACIADWDRLGSAYDGGSLAYSLWDAGTLMAHLHLAVTQSELSGCACAAIDRTQLVTELSLDATSYGHVGTFAFGG